MKKLLFVFGITISALMVSSCQKKCNCKDDFDASVTYYKKDLVSYEGKCWKATTQGRGIIPGPWMQNGNDIWEECTD